MKKFLSSLLAVLLLFCAACSGTTGQNGNNGSDNRTDNRKKTDTSGVYTLGDIYKTEATLSGKASNGVLLYSEVIGGMDSSSVKLFTVDTKTGEKLGSLDLGDGSFETAKTADGVSVFNAENGSITFYDNNLKITENAALTESGAYSKALISYDKKYIIYSAPKGGETKLYDIKNKSDIKLNKTIYGNEFFCYDGTAFLMSDVNSVLYRVDLNGNVIDTKSSKSAHLIYPYIVETNEYGYAVRTTLSPTLQYFPADTAGEYAVAGAEGFFASTTESGALRIYNLGKKCYTEPLTLDEISSVSFTDENTAVVVSNTQNGYKTYIIALDEVKYPQSFVSSDTDKSQDNYFSEVTLSAEEQKIVDSIYKNYGIKIFFSLKSEDNELICYNCPPIDASKRLAYLKYTENYFKILPKGIFKETSPDKDIWLYYCNSVLQDGNKSNVAAFVSTLVDHPLMVLIADGSESYFSEVAAHECAHLFNTHVSVEYLNEWDTLSPSDSFAMSYDAEISNKYVWYDAPNSETFFLDSYCKTFPEEDRAVTAQKLYMSYKEGGLFAPLKNDNTFKKAEFYCKMMRDSFDCCKTEKPYWEKVLEYK